MTMEDYGGHLVCAEGDRGRSLVRRVGGGFFGFPFRLPRDLFEVHSTVKMQLGLYSDDAVA